MSGFTTGLTSLKDPNAKGVSLSPAKPQESPLVNKITSLEAELDRLEKVREKTNREISDLVLQKNRDITQISTELALLKRQKIKLLLEIKEVGKTHFSLTEAKSKGETSFNRFFSDRQDFLISFSSKTLDDISQRLENINEASIRLEKNRGDAEKRTQYATDLKNEALAALQGVVEAKRRLKTEAKAIFDQKMEVDRLSKKAKLDSKESEDKRNAAVKVFDEAERLRKTAERDAEALGGRLDEKTADLRRVATEQGAKEESFKEESHRLKEWERLLKDKEGALRRLANEIRGWQVV